MAHPAKHAVKHDQENSDIKFLSMPTMELYMLSVFTFGIYHLYWFYKNWKAIQIAKPQKMWPFWRAVFSVFWAWPLFREAKDAADEHGYKKPYSPGGLAFLYVVFAVISNGLSRYSDYNLTVGTAAIVILLIASLPLLPVQEAMNFNNERTGTSNGDEPRQRTSAEIGIIAFGLFIFVLGIYSYITSGSA